MLFLDLNKLYEYEKFFTRTTIDENNKTRIIKSITLDILKKMVLTYISAVDSTESIVNYDIITTTLQKFNILKNTTDEENTDGHDYN